LIHVDFNLYEFYTVKCISWKIKVKEVDVRATQRDVHLVSTSSSEQTILKI